MIPSMDDRLSSMLRAVQDVILPALASDQSLAIEQAHLMIGHITMLREQMDGFLAVERAEADPIEALGRNLLAIADGGEATMRAATNLSAVLEGERASDPAGNRAFLHEASSLIEALIEASGADGSATFIAGSTPLIIAAGREASERDRSWFRRTGFERGEVELKPIDELVQQSRGG